MAEGEITYESNGIRFAYVPGDIIKHLHAVMREIGSIKKEKSGTSISYKFRGIDQVYEKLQPLLIKNFSIVLPTGTLSVSYEERETQKGGVLNYCRLVQAYTFFSATDNSYVRAELPGEAMDTSDKSTNKALSAAFKYLAFQGFCIPVEDAEDADAESHDLKPRSQYSSNVPKASEKPKTPSCPGCGLALMEGKKAPGQLYCWKYRKDSDGGGCGFDSLKDGRPWEEQEEVKSEY